MPFIRIDTRRRVRQGTRTFRENQANIINIPERIANPVSGRIISTSGRLFRDLLKQGELYLSREGLVRAPVLDFSELALARPLPQMQIDQITNLVRQTTLNYPIRLDISSNVVDGIEQTLVFYSEEHLINYFTAINRQNYEGQIQGEENVWSNVKVKITPFVPVEGGCNKNKGIATTTTTNINAQNIVLDNSYVDKNNCGIQAIRKFIEINEKDFKVRKRFNLEYRTKIPVDKLHDIYNYYNTTPKQLIVIDSDYGFFIDTNKNNYIYSHNGHYNAVMSNNFVNAVYKRGTKKGYLAFDFETRPTDNIVMHGDNKLNKIKDTICSVVYKDYKSKEAKTVVFTTDSTKTSARKFIEFLISQSLKGKYYHCNAFNGSRFDFYLIYSQLYKEEMVYSSIQLRGFSIIGFKMYNHSFTDLSNFIVNSLANACDSYKIEKGKMTETKYGSSTELCFYKPELSFDEFMKLEGTEFWDEYTKYCIRDTEALFELWEKFRNEINGIVASSRVNNKIKIEQTLTIGSYAKKLSMSLVSPKVMDYYNQFINDDYKYKFVRSCIRGGISYSKQCGVVDDEVVCVDITSQYPDALKNMVVPVGRSKWVDKFDKKAHGYYKLADVVFKDNSFKPIAVKNAEDVLDWNVKSAGVLYLGSQMLNYLIDTGEIIDFTVIRGLVSNHCISGSAVFHQYIDMFFDEKKHQDTLKGTDKYNPAKREVCKLFLNSLSGKLVEDPQRYQQLIFSEEQTDKQLSGNNICYKPNSKINTLVGLGICMYEYSKINLFKSVKLVGAENILNCETDSLFFESKYLPLIEKQVFFGNDLGQINVEGKSSECVFIAKKSYWFDSKKSALKGIPKQTINNAGKKYNLYSRDDFVKLANGESIEFKFNTIKKYLWGNEIFMATGQVSRTVSGI